MQDFIRIHPQDNVAVALQAQQAGQSFMGVTALQGIPAGHKMALKPIAAGEKIIKYASPIGVATADIPAGAWVHTHNVKTLLDGTLEYSYQPQPSAFHHQDTGRTFMGYRRADGRVGIRNEIWIITTVGCVNTSAARLAEKARQRIAGTSIEGVYTFPHPYGCSQMGEDLKLTQKLLAALCRHPNCAGVLVMSLGCENNHLGVFKEVLGPVDESRVKFLVAQEVEDEVEAGLELIDEMIASAREDRREPIPVSELCVGLKCGGSDGFSGITGNPLLGDFSDRLCAAGGTTVMTEVPEMFGAETLLMNRAKDEATFHKVVDLINGFKEYFIRHGQVVYENPSPGNKEGGITTLEDKSLGCTQKGGSSPVVDVLGLGEHAREHGLNLLDGPGNDLVAVTMLTCAHAHLILFTTGRGTPFGAPAPTVKVATNSAMAARKKGWIDFDAGLLLDGHSMEEVGAAFFDYIIALASGETETRAERNGYREIALFKGGVTV